MNLGLSFLKGMVASINPCAFVLLPTYLVYFLGIESAGGQREPGGDQTEASRASLRRALVVSAAVSAGFVGVFVVAGGIAELGTNWLEANAKYVTLVIGLACVIVGLAMLFGYRVPFTAPAVRGGRDRTVRSMSVYGVGYALASLGCTMPLFASAMFGTPDSVGAGFANVVAFALGMALVVTALTVSLAAANQGLVRVLRRATEHVQTVSGALVILAGAYLLHYFWVVDVRAGSSRVTDAMERPYYWFLERLDAHWRVVGVVLGVIVATAFVAVLRRRPSDQGAVRSPDREPSAV